MRGEELLRRLRDRFGAAIVETHEFRGDTTAVVDRVALVDALRFCRDEAALGFDMLTDLTAADYLAFPGR
ncbi:MAG TPA: hypothetical protein VLD67_19550, partial [Vicinamibacterales bacterium]|nr:hypothetical protein [Vicinamibacterales bacterium]